MSRKNSYWLYFIKLQVLCLLLMQSELLGQGFPDLSPQGPVITQPPFDLEGFLEDGGGPVTLVDSIYEFDLSASVLVIDANAVGFEISVFFDGTLIGNFDVRDDSVLKVSLPAPAEAGSLLRVNDANGKLVFRYAVLDRTYRRGNVVESGNYGDNEPDMTDVIFLYDHVISGGPAPNVFEHGDVDANGKIDDGDVFALADYVDGGTSYEAPRADVLFDGTITDIRTADAEDTGLTVVGKKHTPPRPGEGAVLLGSKGTKTVYCWPACTMPVPGHPGKEIRLYSVVPNNVKPTGANSCFKRILCCPPAGGGGGANTYKRIGACVFPNGSNSLRIEGGIIIHKCKNKKDPGHTVNGKPFETCGYVEFKTNPATCEQTACFNTDGVGEVECEYVYNPDGTYGPLIVIVED